MLAQVQFIDLIMPICFLQQSQEEQTFASEVHFDVASALREVG